MNEFQKTIIFTKTPLAGYFRYSDLFQIYPADLEKMPESTFQEHYPVILEYRIKQHEIIDTIPNKFKKIRVPIKDKYMCTSSN